MILLYISILSIIQGITEFLPVSSSAHIVLMSAFFSQFKELGNITEDVLTIAIALHLGTLLSVMVYYNKEVKDMITFKDIKLTTKILLAFIPIAIVGGIITMAGIDILQSKNIIATAMIVFGIILWVSDKYGKEKSTIKDIGYKESIIIGLSQVVALIPGVSRSGATMTAGRFIGMTRPEAVRFSLLLSMPTIGAAMLALIYKFITTEQNQTEMLKVSVLVFILSAIVSYISLKVFVKFAKKFNMNFFVIYRIILGILLLLI